MSVFLAAYFSIFSSLASSGNVARYLENLQKKHSVVELTQLHRFMELLIILMSYFVDNIVVPESGVRMLNNIVDSIVQ